MCATPVGLGSLSEQEGRETMSFRWMLGPFVLLEVASFGCAQRRGSPDFGDRFLPDAGIVDVTDTGRPDAGQVIIPDAGPDLSTVLIYAHSPDVLYRFSAYNNTVEEVASFSLPGGGAAPSMTDLAVNAAGEIYTATRDSLYQVDPETAVARELGTFEIDETVQLNALSFVSSAALGAGEILIGAANDGAFYRVNTSNGRANYLGQYPDKWLSSGDIVSIEGLGTFATCKRSDYPSDVLVEMNFAPGSRSTARVVGPIASHDEDYSQIFGVAYWGRSLYGFTNAGQLISINRDTGAATLVSDDTGATRFWGAGVTTIAPIIW